VIGTASELPSVVRIGPHRFTLLKNLFEVCPIDPWVKRPFQINQMQSSLEKIRCTPVVHNLVGALIREERLRPPISRRRPNSK